MLRVVTTTVILDRQQPLTITQGEDRIMRLVFLDPATADTTHPDGKPVDLSNLSTGGTIVQSLRDGNGGLIVSILGALTTDGTDGSVDFPWGSSDTIDEVPKVDYWDCNWKDSNGEITELAVSAPLEILRSQWRSTDPHRPAPVIVPGEFTQPFSGTSSALIVVPLFTLPAGKAVDYNVRLIALRASDGAVLGMDFCATLINTGTSDAPDLQFVYSDYSVPPYDVVGIPRSTPSADGWVCSLSVDDSTGEATLTLQIDSGSVTGAATVRATTTP